MTVISPQPGPQTQFLKSAADILFFGGGAGGGKSYALLLEPLYHHNNPDFNAVVFRRSTTQVRNPGGLWDQSFNLYSLVHAHPREAALEWEFSFLGSKGMTVKFGHLEHEKTVYDWQGSELPLIEFDELTHFTEKQFNYMFSRNRSMSGVPGRIRGSCNPDVNSWVRRWVDWWIGPDGFPIKERSGILRWFIRINDQMIWADTKQELLDTYGADQQPKSFTFIPSLLHDNKILMEKDPTYRSNLMALSRVERERLLGGNWNVRASAGTIFQRGWFEIIDCVSNSTTILKQVRYWDKGATRPNEANQDPDWTRGLKLAQLHTGIWVITDVRGLRDTPLKVEQFIKNTATQDGYEIPICIEEDPGSSGKADADNYLRLLAGWQVRVRKPTKDKITRALPVSAQCEAGNVKLLRASWNEEFLQELENFGEDGVGHDDQVDTLSGAFNEMTQDVSVFDSY